VPSALNKSSGNKIHVKTAIITHGDTDGVCSGAIALYDQPNASIWFTHPVGLLEDLRRIKAEKIIICDLAVSEREKEDLFEEFLRRSSHESSSTSTTTPCRWTRLQATSLQPR